MLISVLQNRAVRTRGKRNDYNIYTTAARNGCDSAAKRNDHETASKWSNHETDRVRIRREDLSRSFGNVLQYVYDA